MIAAGSNGSNAAASRPQIAPALAVESCCETTVEARPAKPSGRRRSGGRPAFAISAAKRGSAATKRGDAAIEIGLGVDVMVSIRDQGSGIGVGIPDPALIRPMA